MKVLRSRPAICSLQDPEFSESKKKEVEHTLSLPSILGNLLDIPDSG